MVVRNFPHRCKMLTGTAGQNQNKQTTPTKQSESRLTTDQVFQAGEVRPGAHFQSLYFVLSLQSLKNIVAMLLSSPSSSSSSSELWLLQPFFFIEKEENVSPSVRFIQKPWESKICLFFLSLFFFPSSVKPSPDSLEFWINICLFLFCLPFVTCTISPV